MPQLSRTFGRCHWTIPEEQKAFPVRKVRVTPGQDIARVKADLGLGDTDNISRDLLERVRRSLAVDSLVLGSYTVIGEPPSRLIRIDARLVDAATGKVITTSASSGTETQLFDLVSRVIMTGPTLGEDHIG